MKSSKPSVLMITYQYAPAADGGAARQAQLLAEQLASRGRRVGVVTARFPGHPSVERLGNVDVHRVWAIPRPGWFSMTFIPSLARFLALRGRRYDIWHAHQAFYNAGAVLTLARVLHRLSVVKVAASGRYGDVARLRRATLGRWVRRELLMADAIVSLNAEMTGELRDLGIAPGRIRRIPNGVDCTAFSPPTAKEREDARAKLGLEQDAVVVVCAGRLAEDTGTRFLIEAWRTVEELNANERWTLLVVGDELPGGSLRERGIRELRRARFLDKVADIRPLLRAADVLVRPSVNEGMSNIVLEAMAMGLPVLATRTGGLLEQVEDRVTGWLVAPGDSRDLSQGLMTLLRNNADLVGLGSSGRARAERLYSLPAVVREYEELYDSLTFPAA